MAANDSSLPDALMIGTGEYTTGFVHEKESASDKRIGVIALCVFDMQSSHRKRIGKAKMVGTNGTRFPGIREHFRKNVTSFYTDINTEFESFPADSVQRDAEAYKTAINSMRPGDFATIVTPDDTHYAIAEYAIQRGLHVLLTKPPVKTLEEQIALAQLAAAKGVLASVEYHKRFDPMYADARERIRGFGDFSYFSSYMSQPKFQLHTFKSWAGKSSDISYYLNSHHIDFHCWCMQGLAVPIRVNAMASYGIASSATYGCPSNTEDTITLLVQWKNIQSGNLGLAVYTASWSVPKSDVHSQQRFQYVGHKGEINIDQAHRGYTQAADEGGYISVNPLYMKYTRDAKGRFSGQQGYGYRSIEAFVDAVTAINAKQDTAGSYDAQLPTLRATLMSTAILEGGRRSLDNAGKAFSIQYKDQANEYPVIVPC